MLKLFAKLYPAYTMKEEIIADLIANILVQFACLQSGQMHCQRFAGGRFLYYRILERSLASSAILSAGKSRSLEISHWR